MIRQIRNLFLIIIITTICFVPSIAKNDNELGKTDRAIYLKENWQYKLSNPSLQSDSFYKTTNDTSWEKIDNPSNYSRHYSADIWFRKILPDWKGKDPALFIRMIKDMAEVYIDDQKIYSTGDFSSRDKIAFSGLSWHLIELPHDFTGKMLIIHIRSRHSYPGINGDILLGSNREIISDIIKKNLIITFLALLYISSAIISILLLFHIKEFSKYKGFIILQISMGIWTLVNLPVLQLIINAPKTIYYLDHVSMFTTAIGFAFLAETIIAARYKNIFKRIKQFLVFIVPVIIVIDFTLLPFHRYIAIPFYIILMIFILVFMFFSVKSYRNVGATAKFFILGLNAYALFAFIEIARYYIGIFSGESSMDVEFLHMGGFCLFFFLTWIIVSQYVNMNKQIITSKERERERISRDLHDEIGPRLTEIKIVSELVKQENNSGKNIDEKLNDLSFASDNVLSAFREIIWALNPANNTLEELGTYIGQFASDFLSKADISCRLELPPEFPDAKIPYDFRRNIIMAVKESLNNIVKHADASIVKVNVKTIDRNLIIEIKDDGHGFDTKTINPYGNGLKNIYYRVETFGGKAAIESIVNSGTTITMQIPFGEISYSQNGLL